MFLKPDHKKLIQVITFQISQQENERFVAITPGWIEECARAKGIVRVHGPGRWKDDIIPIFIKLGLVDDGTNTNTFTRPEHVAIIQDIITGYRVNVDSLLKE